MAHGYATTSPCVVLGTIVVDGAVHPDAQVQIPLAMFNRHGLVAGATGTGKTKTLQVIAEQLSAAGVPVLIPDIKGDLTGMVTPGAPNDRITQRAADTGDHWTATGFPVEYLTLAGQGTGVPIRATIDSFGPILLSKVLGLNDTQESTLGLIFHFADQKNLPLLDIKDLRSVIGHLTSAEGKADLKELGGVSSSTAGVILRAVTNLEAQGGDVFFGEPQLDVSDLLRTAPDGRGVISLLETADLQSRPELFSTFLMWLLAELFEDLPEVGDLDKPKLVFLFDEAHLLFADASKAFGQAVQQTVKLIRSKGVGVFFCSQLPTDLPGPVLSQLGARIQHALRAFTPDDQKALSQTVRTYPTSKIYDLESALTSLATGEAIVTVLSETGAPTPVAWTRVRAPRSLMGPADPAAVTAAVAGSSLQAKYGQAIDRESAYELLTGRLAGPAAPAGSPAPANAPAATVPAPPAQYESLPPVSGGFEVPQPYDPPPSNQDDDSATITGTASAPQSSGSPAGGGFLGDVMGSPVVKSFMRSLGTSLGGALGRSVFGTRTRSRRR
ncbi:helicase HerA-like domain-containing protein [Nakamurella sp. UYEF19]|uniref:helicase HerA-like domain-containing protein n=1 Tax=Nakamurella sp. UYEF19 TaxID=1756392 RepID=UPI003398A7C1